MAFNTHRYLNSNQRTHLAHTLNLTETQVSIKTQRLIGMLSECKFKRIFKHA